MTNLDQNLATAWAQRADAAATDLQHADTAPALFKPEFATQRRADFDHAIRQIGRVTR